MKIYWLDFILGISTILLLAYGVYIDNWRYMVAALVFGVISFFYIVKRI